MSMEVSVEFAPKFYKKIDSDNFKKCVESTLKKCGEEAVKECISECPVVTGNLRDHHSLKTSKDVVEVVNDCGYAGYVAFGTSKQAPNNYPSRVISKLKTDDFIGNAFEKECKSRKLI